MSEAAVEQNDTSSSSTAAAEENKSTTAEPQSITGPLPSETQPVDDSFQTMPRPPLSRTGSTSTATMRTILQSTLWDIQCRSEVEATLNDLVTDVEFAVNLQQQLKVQTHQSQAERIIAEQQLALEETNVVQKDRLKSQTLLADALVKDLWSLSKEVGSLLELKQKHEAMALEYDEVVAKLAQAEEDLQAARTQQAPPSQQQHSRQQQQPTQAKSVPPAAKDAAYTTDKSVASTGSSQKPAAKSDGASIKSAQDSTKSPQQDKTVESSGTTLNVPVETVVAPSTADTAVQEEKESVPKSTTEGENNEEGSDSKRAPVVALVNDEDHDEQEDPPATLETIDMEILMRIFGFLDALDILNTAQVNISMYSRVDSLFGFGMDAPSQDDNSTIATTPTVAAATSQQPPATVTTASLSTSNTSTAGATNKSTPAAANATARAPASATKQSEQPQFGHRLGLGGGRGLLNILAGGGGRVDAGGVNANSRQQQKSKAGGVGRGRGASDASDGGGGGSKPPLSEAMAHSMAAKLNDAEINAIISMTEKLRAKEKQAALMLKEKEELEGKLSGSEAVKDFLINKVRDMEKSMNKSNETEKKVTQQIASDQEVIAFLDGRVQELEQQTRAIQKEKNAAQDKLKSVIAQNDKKVAVLSDMLQFERQKLKENEREWKATKKLLVKEVKGCRAQIVALQAERDGFREQNDALRKAVMASGSGGATSNGRSSSPHR